MCLLKIRNNSLCAINESSKEGSLQSSLVSISSTIWVVRVLWNSVWKNNSDFNRKNGDRY